MKLELKHLSPYLPYGLQMLNTKSGKITTITGAAKDGIDIVVMDNGRSYDLGIWPLTPILRPLSELTENFLIDGIEDVTNYISKNEIYKIKNKPLYYMPYGQFQRLYSWHFDVFGLIPAGLATPKQDI